MIQTWKLHGSPYWNYPRLFSLLTSIPEAVDTAILYPIEQQGEARMIYVLCSVWLCGESGHDSVISSESLLLLTLSGSRFWTSRRRIKAEKSTLVDPLIYLIPKLGLVLFPPNSCDSVNIAVTTGSRHECPVTSLQDCPEHIQTREAHCAGIVSHTESSRAKLLFVCGITWFLCHCSNFHTGNMPSWEKQGSRKYMPLARMTCVVHRVRT